MFTAKEKKQCERLPITFRNRIHRMLQVIEGNIQNKKVKANFWNYTVTDTLIAHFDIFLPRKKSFHLVICWSGVANSWQFYCTSFCERISDRIVIIHGEYEDRIVLFSFDEMLKETRQLLKWVQKD
jgi:hypothetical protein